MREITDRNKPHCLTVLNTFTTSRPMSRPIRDGLHCIYALLHFKAFCVSSMYGARDREKSELVVTHVTVCTSNIVSG